MQSNLPADRVAAMIDDLLRQIRGTLTPPTIR